MRRTPIRRRSASTGATPDRLDGHAEALIALADGVITADARGQPAEQSPNSNADNARARYYLAPALEQEGKKLEALAAFEALAKAAPAARPGCRSSASISPFSAAAGSSPGNPTAGDMAAAEEMSAGDRQQMIAGMVETLAAKLQENPENFEGWMRIIRSYVVGSKAEGRSGATDGAETFLADSENGKQLLALARDLSISVEGNTQ